MSLVETRRHQMFPVLDLAQIETAKRYASGEARSFAPGAIVYDVGERSAPAWLVVEGTIEVVRRDGLNHETATATLGIGQFTGEVSQLADAPRWQQAELAQWVAPPYHSTPLISARSWSARRRLGK
jgi:thioredoxin reductase (NADPH)